MCFGFPATSEFIIFLTSTSERKYYTVPTAMGSPAGFRFPAGARDFLYSTASRPALGPTQPPIQWVPEAFSPKAKRPGSEDDHSPTSNAEVKNNGAYLHSPIRLHGAVLN
jgi:hypothetical protein